MKVAESGNDRTLVIGAGISGLSVARQLKKQGLAVVVLEANSAPGGVIRTWSDKGYQGEDGPNTLMVSDPKLKAWLQDLEVWDEAIDAAPSAQKRFIVKEGKLLALPMTPLAFLSSPALSLSGKLRMLKEPWIGRGEDSKETLADFVRRRLGKEPLQELIGPFVSGVYAGDPERLLVRYAFPKLWELEQRFQSLIRGAIHRKKEKSSVRENEPKESLSAGPQGKLVSWRNGLGHLVNRLRTELGDDLLCSSRVIALTQESAGYTVQIEGGTLLSEQAPSSTGNQTIFRGRRIILATDSMSAAKLLEPVAGKLKALQHIPYASVAVVHLGFDRKDVGHPLDGFGVLVSRERKIRILGALFSSTLFSERAPEGKVLFTVFVGGRRDPDAVSLSSEALIELTVHELGALIQLNGPACFQKVTKWQRAIPQYEEGYEAALDECRELEENLPGVHLLGNYRGGISLENCILNAVRMAESFRERLDG
jgi:oxygen-dependent protoporphyrinogen oxidase